jgi:hypothetical protein
MKQIKGGVLHAPELLTMRSKLPLASLRKTVRAWQGRHHLQVKRDLELIEEHVVLTVIADGIESPLAATRPSSRNNFLRKLGSVGNSTTRLFVDCPLVRIDFKVNGPHAIGPFVYKVGPRFSMTLPGSGGGIRTNRNHPKQAAATKNRNKNHFINLIVDQQIRGG